MVVSLLGRGARFFMVAGLFYFWGAEIRSFVEARLEWLTVGFSLFLIGIWMGFRWLGRRKQA
jgi:hypothetical protein